MSAASVISHTDPKTLAELDVSSPRFPVARPVAQSQPSKTTGTTAKSTVSSTAKSTQKTTTTLKSN
jgi:hypothetical protein